MKAARSRKEIENNGELERINNKRLCTEAAPRKKKMKRTPYIRSERRDHIQRYRQTMLRQHIEMIYESNKFAKFHSLFLSFATFRRNVEEENVENVEFSRRMCSFQPNVSDIGFC